MKKIGAFLLAVALCVSLAACGNRQIFDTTYTYDRVIITLPNGEVVDGKIQSWRDYKDGDQIQVTVDGKTYLAHSSNIILITD